MPHAKHDRGQCAECGADSALRADGTPYRHYTRRRATGDPLYCPGSGRVAIGRSVGPRVVWKDEDSLKSGARIGPTWVNGVSIGWLTHTQARAIAVATRLRLEEV